MTYRAIPLAALLSEAGRRRSPFRRRRRLRHHAAGGMLLPRATARPRLARGRARRCAVAAAAGGETASAGPFYLVWTQPSAAASFPSSGRTGSRASRRPGRSRCASGHRPPPGLAPTPRSTAGSLVSAKHCIVCHTLNLGGDAIDRARSQRPVQPDRVPARRRAAPDHSRSAVAAPVAVDADAAASMLVLSDRELNDVLATCATWRTRRSRVLPQR